jgi:glycosyltransferase involved in cell wall biosynthesis
MNKLSIVVPAYNEANTIAQTVNKILEVKLIGGFQKEIIIVNDCSTDATETVVQNFMANHKEEAIMYFKHEKNKGKGAALHTGIEKATGSHIIVQDADLEYDPHEFNILLQPIINGHADVVYGSRFIGGKPHRILFFWHTIGNKFLTFISNMFSNLNLTDMETCYKCFKREIIQSLHLQENRFGIEPDLTGKIAAGRWKVYEVGISYSGRSYDEGKKIGWRDGVRAVYCIVRYSKVGDKLMPLFNR